MTPEQNFTFRNLLSNLLNARAIGETDARQLAHEDHLRNYVDGLLDEKDVEIAALKARQITPEMWALFDEAKEAGKQGNGGREFFAIKEFFALIEMLRQGDES